MLGNAASTPEPTSVASGSVAGGAVNPLQGFWLPIRKLIWLLAWPGMSNSLIVVLGDQVQAGQVLIQLDDTVQQVGLQQANLALRELTSPESVANAKLAITTDQTNVTNAQTALNNLQYWQNPALVKNYYANYVLAKANLDKAQTNYDNSKAGVYISTSNQAAAYNALYTAQQAYNTAFYYYSLYSQAPTQNQQDQAQANLDLANATLKSDQDYLAALTGGTVPTDATGTDLLKLQQAQLAVQTAQQNLDATRLLAPFAGEVASVASSVGDYVSPGQLILVLSDVNHMHVETTDLSERDVPKVKLGQAATVTIKALNQDVPGKVSAISPQADSLGGDVVYKVTILLNTLPANLRSGMSVDVQFNTGQ